MFSLEGIRNGFCVWKKVQIWVDPSLGYKPVQTVSTVTSSGKLFISFVIVSPGPSTLHCAVDT